jgi:hypothetical protein
MSASPSAVAGAVERAVGGRVVARAVGGSAVVGGPSHALSSGCAGTSANSYRTAAARLPCRPPPADARDDRPRVDRPRVWCRRAIHWPREAVIFVAGLARAGRGSPRFALASTTAPAADRRELDDPAVLERRREAPATVMRSAGSMATRERHGPAGSLRRRCGPTCAYRGVVLGEEDEVLILRVDELVAAEVGQAVDDAGSGPPSQRRPRRARGGLVRPRRRRSRWPTVARRPRRGGRE